MPGEVELCDEHEPEIEPEHRFSVPAKKVMVALVIGLVVSLIATAFSYAHFKGQNEDLQRSLRQRVPSEDGITIQIEDAGLNYFCVDEGADGSFVCTVNE